MGQQGPAPYASSCQVLTACSEDLLIAFSVLFHLDVRGLWQRAWSMEGPLSVCWLKTDSRRPWFQYSFATKHQESLLADRHGPGYWVNKETCMANILDRGTYSR